jgi:hypothetical protein
MCARCARAGGVGASSPQMRRANANETGLCGASRGRCYCGKQASKQAGKQALGFPGWLLVKVMGMYAVKVLRAL